MLKRSLFASLAFSLLLAGCGGSNDSDDDSGAYPYAGTYGVIARAPGAPVSERLYEGNVTVSSNGALSGQLFGAAQETIATVSGTLSRDGTLNLNMAFTQPVVISGTLTEGEEELTGNLDGTIQTGPNSLEEFEAIVTFGPPLA